MPGGPTNRIVTDLQFTSSGLAGVERDIRRATEVGKSGGSFVDPTNKTVASVRQITAELGALEARALRADKILERVLSRHETGSAGANRIIQRRADLQRDVKEMGAATREIRRPAPGERPLNMRTEYRRAQELANRQADHEANRLALRESTERARQRRADEQAQVRQRAADRARVEETRRIEQASRLALPTGPPPPLALPRGPKAIPVGPVKSDKRYSFQEEKEARDDLGAFRRRHESDAKRIRQETQDEINRIAAEKAAARRRRSAEEETAAAGGAAGGGGGKPPPAAPPGEPSPRPPRPPRGGKGQSADDVWAQQPTAERTPREIAQDLAETQRKKVEQQRLNLAAVTPEDRQARALLGVEEDLARSQQRLAEVAARRSSAGQAAYQQELQLARETSELNSERLRMRAADGNLIRALAAEANARQEDAARLTVARLGTREDQTADLAGVSLLARAAVLERTAADRKAAAVTDQTTRADIDAAAEKKLAQAKLRVAINSRERQLFKEAAAAGTLSVGDQELPKAGWFQNLQFALHPTGDKLPQEHLTARQFIGDKFQRTLGYAVSGAALGGTLAAVSEMVKDATALEVTFVRLRGQMEGIGQVNAFPQVRDQIRDIAAETGQASNEVAKFQARMTGLTGDPQRAIADTASAMKLATVTGADMATLETSLVPIQKTFGVSTEEVGDKVVALSEKFGLAGDDLLKYLGKTAAVAKASGGTFDELAAFGSNIANSLGKPIDAAAENTNKVFGQLENNKDKIFQILAANPETATAIDPMIDAFANGDTMEAYKQLLQVAQKLTTQQRSALLTNISSRREAEEFNATIQNAPSILNDMAEAQANAGQNSGKLENRFKDLKSTVAITGQTLNAAFESLGDTIFRSGAAEVIVDFGNALKLVVGAAGGLFAIFAKLNDIPGVGPLARMAATAFLLTRAFNVLANARDLTNKVTSRSVKTETEDSVAKDRTTASTTREAAAEQDLAAARGRNAGGGTGPLPGPGPAPSPGPAPGPVPGGGGGSVGGFPYNVSGAGTAGGTRRVNDAAAAADAMTDEEIAAAAARARSEARASEIARIARERRERAEEMARRRKADRLSRDIVGDLPTEQPPAPIPPGLPPAPIERLITRPYTPPPPRPPRPRPPLPGQIPIEPAVSPGELVALYGPYAERLPTRPYIPPPRRLAGPPAPPTFPAGQLALEQAKIERLLTRPYIPPPRGLPAPPTFPAGPLALDPAPIERLLTRPYTPAPLALPAPPTFPAGQLALPPGPPLSPNYLRALREDWLKAPTPLPPIRPEDLRQIRNAWLEPPVSLPPIRPDELRRLRTSSGQFFDRDLPLALPRGRDFDAIQTLLPGGAPLPVGPGVDSTAAEFVTRARIDPITSTEFRALQEANSATRQFLRNLPLALPRGRDFDAVQTTLSGGAPIPVGAGGRLLADERRRITAGEYTSRSRIDPIRSTEFRELQSAREEAARDALSGNANGAWPAGRSRAFELPAAPSVLQTAQIDKQVQQAARLANAEAQLAERLEAAVAAPGLGSFTDLTQFAPLALLAGRGRNLPALRTPTDVRPLGPETYNVAQPIAPEYHGPVALPPAPILALPSAGSRLPVIRGEQFGFDEAALSRARTAEAAALSSRLEGVSRLARDAGGPMRGTRFYNPAYEARKAQYAEQFAATGVPRLGLVNQALSGGSLLGSAKADAIVGTTPGAKAGLAASPGWAAAIAIAAAAAIKAAYDEAQSSVKSQIEVARAAAAKANADGLKLITEYNSNIVERTAAAVFGTPLAEEIGKSETLFRQTSDVRRLVGGKYYHTPTAPELKAGEATQASIAERQKEINKQVAKNLPGQAATDILDALNQDRYGRGIAAQAGLDVTQIGELPTGVDDNSGIWGYNPYSLALKGLNAVSGRSDLGHIGGDKEKISKVMELLAAKGADDPAASALLAKIKPAWEKGETPDLLAAANQAAEQGLFAEATVAGGMETAINTLKDPHDAAFKSLNELQSDLESGKISMQEFLDGKTKALAYVDKQAKAYTGLDKEQYTIQQNKQRVDTENMIAKSVQDFSNLYTITAQERSTKPKQAARDILMQAMSQMPSRIAVENLPTMLQADLAAADEQFASIADPSARREARKRGAPISETTRKTYNQKLFKENKQASDAAANMYRKATKLGAFQGMSLEQFTDAISSMSASQGITPEQAAQKMLDGEIAKMETLRDEANAVGDREVGRELSKQRDQLVALRPEVEASFRDLPDLDTKPDENKQRAIDIEENAKARTSKAKVLSAEYADNPLQAAIIASNEADAQYLDMLEKRKINLATDDQVADARAAKIDSDNNKRKAQENLAKIRDNWAVINANGDPMAELAAERGNLLKERDRLLARGDKSDEGLLIQNEQALAQNNQQQNRGALDIVRSGMSITEALVERSPVEAARAALRRAEFEEQNAIGVAAQQEATANRIRASHGLEDALSQGLEARASLAIAVAEANDQDVEAKRIAATEARRKLDNAVHKGLTGDDLAPYQQAVVSADRDVIRTSVQDQVDTIDFMQQMGQISMSQAISSLQAVLATVKVGSDEYKSLSLKIRSLTQSAQQDLQFNLPTTLGLPTLYESRRARQDLQQGVGYQDNRNVVVSIAVNGAQDPSVVATQVASALQSSLRGGNTYTAAVPIGV